MRNHGQKICVNGAYLSLNVVEEVRQQAREYAEAKKVVEHYVHVRSTPGIERDQAQADAERSLRKVGFVRCSDGYTYRWSIACASIVRFKTAKHADYYERLERSRQG
jgi:hypothetical protein